MSGPGNARIGTMPNQDNDGADIGQFDHVTFDIRNRDAPNSRARRDTSSTAC